MSSLKEAEQKWAREMLALLGSQPAPNSNAPALVRAVKEILPTHDAVAKTFGGNESGARFAEVMPESVVNMAGPSDGSNLPGGGTGAVTGAHGGGTGGGTGSGGGSGGTGGDAKSSAFEMKPDRVNKMSDLKAPIFKSVSSQAHADAWLGLHKRSKPVPVAFIVGKNIYVDMDRWPIELPRPNITPHAPGGPKVNPKPGQKVDPMHFPNDGNNSLGGTSGEQSGGRRGPGGNQPVPDNQIAARFKKAPGNVAYTFSSKAHSEIWRNLGNNSPAPIAFIQDGHMRVDVERWALHQGNWSAERLNQIGLKPKDTRIPTPPGHGGVPPVTGGKPGGVGNVDVDVKKAEAFIRDAHETNKQAKGAKVDSAKVGKQTAALESDGAKLAKQFQSHPDMAALRGGSTKQFFAGVKAKFGSVRANVAGVVMLALNVADAYELVQAVRSILDSKSVEEALQKTLQIGGEMAKEAAKFGALRFVVRRTPIAIGITVFFGDMDKNSKKTPERLFAESVRDVVNKVRPGAVKRLGWMGTTDEFEDPDAKKLYFDAYEQAVSMLKGRIAKDMSKIGITDALTGWKTKKFEVTKDDRDILGIDDKWLEQMYNEGHAQGNRQRTEAIKRAEQAGFNDGKEGKPSNFEAVQQWPELQALIQGYQKNKTQISNEELHTGQVIFNDYENSYNRGYEEGSKIAKALVLAKLEISPNGFTMGAHALRKLVATGTFTNKSTKNLSGESKWRSSDDSVVQVVVDGGVAYASMMKPGRAEVVAAYDGVHGSKEAKIAIVVNPPKIAINPEKPTLKVGEKLRFRAYSIDPANDADLASELDSEFVFWTSDDQNRIAMDSDGNATIRAAGPPVKINVTYKNSPVQVSALVTIR